MPEKLHLSYLRTCYKENALARGKMKMAGVSLDLSKIKVPVYLQSAKEDHIARPIRCSSRSTCSADRCASSLRAQAISRA